MRLKLAGRRDGDKRLRTVARNEDLVIARLALEQETCSTCGSGNSGKPLVPALISAAIFSRVMVVCARGVIMS